MNQKLLSILTKYKKIILVGGGTGGHIQPIVSLVKHIQKTHKIIDFLWIGGDNSQEKKTAQDENIQFQSIGTLKLSTTKSFKILLYPIVLIQGILEARKMLRSVVVNGVKQSSNEINSNLPTYQPTNLPLCVFSKGGPGSVAIGIAAWSLSIPLFIHESDTIPGRSNILLEKIATKVFLGFESAKQYFDTKKCEVVGQILDPVFQASFGKEVPDRAEEFLRLRKSPGIITGKDDSFPLSKEGLSWNTNKPHILVICGSQGAKTVFEAIIQQFSKDTDYEWIIALGKLNSEMKQDFDTIPNIQALEWIDQADIAHLIQGTNLAITRGSATALAELTVSEKKPQLIIIPLPYSAGNHQFYNAKEYEKLGCQILEQKNIKALKNTVRTLLK